MSNEYSAPPVLLFEAAGIGASVTSRRPLSSGVGVSPLVCACAADRTSKEASAPRPKSLPHRAIAYGAASRLLDIPFLLLCDFCEQISRLAMVNNRAIGWFQTICKDA